MSNFDTRPSGFRQLRESQPEGGGQPVLVPTSEGVCRRLQLSLGYSSLTRDDYTRMGTKPLEKTKLAAKNNN